VHELSIAICIVEGVLEELQRVGATRASAVHVRVGRLSSVDKDALQFSYDVACHETPLADSRLIIEDVEVAILCPVCHAERETRSFPVLSCVVCGTLAEQVVRGQELEITGMEVAT
jgi:hydrogenase nickel incorporation protein HypA/HybF